MTQHEVDNARGILRELVGGQILLHPAADGAERFLTTVLSGDYSGLVRLVVSSTDGNYELETAEVFMHDDNYDRTPNSRRHEQAWFGGGDPDRTGDPRLMSRTSNAM